MRVQLRNDWFAPNVSVRVGTGELNLTVGGRLYEGRNGREAGIHDIPAELREHLPASAKVLDEEVADAPAPKTKVKEKSFKDYDEERANSDALAEIVKNASKEN